MTGKKKIVQMTIRSFMQRKDTDNLTGYYYGQKIVDVYKTVSCQYMMKFEKWERAIDPDFKITVYKGDDNGK